MPDMFINPGEQIKHPSSTVGEDSLPVLFLSNQRIQNKPNLTIHYSVGIFYCGMPNAEDAITWAQSQDIDTLWIPQGVLLKLGT